MKRLLRDKATATKTGGRVKNRLGSGASFSYKSTKKGSTPAGNHFNFVKVRGGR